MKNLFAFLLVASFAVLCLARDDSVLDDPESLYKALLNEIEKLKHETPENFDNLLQSVQAGQVKIIRQRYPLKGAGQKILKSKTLREIYEFYKRTFGQKPELNAIKTGSLVFPGRTDSNYLSFACAGKVKQESEKFLYLICINTDILGKRVQQYEMKNFTVCEEKENEDGEIVKVCHDELRKVERDNTEEENKIIENVFRGKSYAVLKKEIERDMKENL